MLLSACIMLVLFAGALLLWRYWWERAVLNSEDKFVLITGCDSGFGFQLARRLHAHGFHVFGACLTKQGEHQLRQSCSTRLHTLQLDIRCQKSVNHALAIVTSTIGTKGLWGLVNNAGISGVSAPTDWQTVEEYKRGIDVNLMGMIRVTLAFLPLVKRTHGRIINMSSICGRIALSAGSYCVSKYGVEAFSDSLRRDMKPFGVMVSIISPGIFRTNFIDPDKHVKGLLGLWNDIPQDVKKDYGPEYISKCAQKIKNMIEVFADKDLSKVVDCMEHGLSAVYPRSRYTPGWDAKFYWLPLAILPAAIQDWMLNLGSISRPIHHPS
uniref:Dehydrogenase/reductase (SDR family) member 9 n=1 Tax=Eptatretus burgeri TaxID=7764 RepID=A0A8C4QMS1_EPTBU